MTVSRIAAVLYAVLALVGVMFQIALAAGAPWGELAMAGRFPGQLPVAMRVAAVVQAGILVMLALTVLIRAGCLLPRLLGFSRRAIWFVVAFTFVALTLNLITPSPRERNLWAPVALGMVVCSLVVALRQSGRPSGPT